MLRKFLSRFHPRYPHVLVSMLQTSEYYILDYLFWLKKTADFVEIEKKHHLKKTPKSLFLFGFIWLVVVVIYGLALYLLWKHSTIQEVMLSLGMMFFTPLALSYFLIIPLVFIKIFIQKPHEHFALKKAEKTLATMSASKIAIAGNFGRDSMRETLCSILSIEKVVAYPPNHLHSPLGICEFVKTLTGKEEVLIFEFGEYYRGDIRKLSRAVNPDIGIITGISEAHLPKFKKLEKITKTIFELADFLKEKPLYINAESFAAKENAQAQHILYSRHKVGEWKIPEKDLKVYTQIDFQYISQIGVSLHIARRLGLSVEKVIKELSQTQILS